MSADTLTLLASTAVALAWVLFCRVAGVWWPESGDGGDETPEAVSRG